MKDNLNTNVSNEAENPAFLVGAVSERYSKDDIRKYEDGWWITSWHEKRKMRIRIIGSFKTRQLAENDREILNAR
jgi:hypothetical protein